MSDKHAMDNEADLFQGMRFNGVISLMAAFHNKVQATLGSETPDTETLDAWWSAVEPREWQAFQEHLKWLRAFELSLNRYMHDHHIYHSGGSRRWATPPMVRELAPRQRRG